MAINTAQSLVLRTQGLPHGKNKRTSACISKMKAKFLSCGKRSTKNQGEQLQLVVVEAKGACVRRKLSARYGRRLATPIPSSNRHMPCIRTLRINQNLRNCTKCNITHSQHAYHCPQDNITVPLGTISLACRCGSITKSPFASALCMAESQKGFSLSFDYFVCSRSILSMTRSTTSNPSPTVSAEKRSGTS